MKNNDKNGEQGDLFAGRKARDEGIGRVSDHNETWIAKCQREAALFAASRDTFTGEDIRFHCQEYVGEPKHHNAWGALTCSLVKRKVIVATGQWAQSKDKTSHATLIQVYRRANS
jgi:hypothetical protein